MTNKNKIYLLDKVMKSKDNLTKDEIKIKYKLSQLLNDNKSLFNLLYIENILKNNSLIITISKSG